jgi:D-alanine transaminase
MWSAGWHPCLTTDHIWLTIQRFVNLSAWADGAMPYVIPSCRRRNMRRRGAIAVAPRPPLADLDALIHLAHSRCDPHPQRPQSGDKERKHMTRTVYLNGDYLPETEANVSIFDRGFVMGDAVYEVTSVLGGQILEFDGHIARLTRSLEALGMTNPMDRAEWLAIHRKLVELNDMDEGLIYLQVSRGNGGDRDFAYPPAGTPQTVVLFTQAKPGLAANPQAKTGIRVISIPDLRWGRRDIKTVQLLYPSMAKMEAKHQGVDDAWFTEDGFVTEGTSNNTYIVKGGKIVTRQLSNDILHGITRASLLRYAAEAQMQIEERPFTIAEAQAADEAFFTSASAFVMPVVEVDGVRLGDGKPGPVATRLRELYLEESRKAAV